MGRSPPIVSHNTTFRGRELDRAKAKLIPSFNFTLKESLLACVRVDTFEIGAYGQIFAGVPRHRDGPAVRVRR